MNQRKTVVLNADLHREIKLQAAQRGIGISNLIADAWEGFKCGGGAGSKASVLRRALMDQKHRALKMVAELDGAIHDR